MPLMLHELRRPTISVTVHRRRPWRIRSGKVSNQIMLRCYTDLLLAYKKAIADVETRMNLLAEANPAYHLLKSIPGVGVIPAEVEDIKRFPGSKQLSVFAGLDEGKLKKVALVATYHICG